jgi:DNA-binding transcriptional LysR family regulator
MLDSRKLRMLSELDRLGTVGAVAKLLHLSAPGVSMQLSSLEREVGVTLTEKQGRRIALTPAGRLLAQHGHRIVDMLHLAETEVAALREGAAGTYSLAAFPSAARTFVAHTWRQLLQQPEQDLRLRLTECERQDALAGLANGAYDMAVTHSYSNMAPADDTALVATRILSEPVWLATRHDDPAIKRPAGPSTAVDLAQFAAHDWVMPHERLSCYQMAQRACGLAGFSPRRVAEASDFSVLIELVAVGAGVALVPQLTVARAPEGVHLHPLKSPIFRHDFVVTRGPAQPDPGIQRLTQLLRDSARSVLGEQAAGRQDN